MTHSIPDNIYGSPNDYKPFGEFVRSYPSLSFIQFDSYVSEKLDLFALPDNFDFGKLKNDLDLIAFALPSMIRIFERPIIRLRDTEELLPVEAARKTGRNTVRYAATHSKTWESFDENGIRPRSLLTEKYEDDFSIYENIVFTKAVDTALSYLTANMRLVGSLMYAGSRQLNIDALARVNHINYFLALGKLHTGYIRNFRKNSGDIAADMRRMGRMYTALSAHLSYPVYVSNRDKYNKIPLKKTNIFAMDKNYKRVYKLLGDLGKTSSASGGAVTVTENEQRTNYRYFCLILLVFSAYHFGFRSDDSEIIDFDKPYINMCFKDWTLRVSGDGDSIVLDFSKERKYRVEMIPCISGDTEILKLRKADENGEISVLTPMCDGKDSLCISVSDIDSFRRFQQLLLRGMVYSDLRYDTCPFCGSGLSRVFETGENAKHVCSSCGIRISEKICPVTGGRYFETGMTGFIPAAAKRGLPLYKDCSELLYYRNITPITIRGDNICPRCKTVHK